jgi:hypothetical protein
MEHWGINGKEQWWAHSIMLPDDFLMPPAGWMVLFGFHDDRNQGGQGNVSIFADSNGMSFKGHAGPEIPFDARGNAMSYGGNIVAAVVRRVWFEFVYHVRWSWGRDGFFDAWINGKRKLSHQGPTLYDGYGVYLKLANYHSAFDKPTSVLHRRIVRGSTMRSVTDTTLEGLS